MFYQLAGDVPEEIQFQIDESNGYVSSSADCILRVRGEVEIKRKVNVLKRITKHQQMFVTYFEMSHFFANNDVNKETYEEVMNILIHNLRLSKEIETFSIESVCLLPREYEHIAQQLKDCLLRYFELRMIFKFLPVQLGETIATMTSLEIAKINLCLMKEDARRALLSGLSHI